MMSIRRLPPLAQCAALGGLINAGDGGKVRRRCELAIGNNQSGPGLHKGEQMNFRKWCSRVSVAAAFLTLAMQAQSTSEPAQVAQAQTATPPPVSELTLMASAIACSDLDRSIDFYIRGMGMTLSGRVEMGTVTEAPLTLPGGGAYLMLLKSGTQDAVLPVRSMQNRVILAVPDLRALEARLVAAGYHFKSPITELPKYRLSVAQLEDPGGNQMELVQRNH